MNHTKKFRPPINLVLIKETMRQRGWKPEQVAQEIARRGMPISTATIYNLVEDRNAPSVATLYAVAQVLELKWSDLILSPVSAAAPLELVSIR